MSKRKNLQLIEQLTATVKTQGERIDTLQKALNTVLERNPQLVEQDKPKTLDQSVFDGQDEEWRWAAVDYDGRCVIYADKPEALHGRWRASERWDVRILGEDYDDDAADWQNSLIEREAKPLSGNERIKKLLERQKLVMIAASDLSYDDAASEDGYRCVCVAVSSDEYGVETDDACWAYGIPIDNNGNEVLDVE